MALVRWSPTSDLMNLHSEMDRLFTELTEGLGAPRLPGNGGSAQTGFLPLDIERSDDALIIRASVPGFKPEEVNVSVDNGVLTIDAQRHEEKETKDKERNYLRKERFTGRVFRQIALGDSVDGDRVEASFNSGELTVTAPLTKSPQPKKIPVKAAS